MILVEGSCTLPALRPSACRQNLQTHRRHYKKSQWIKQVIFAETKFAAFLFILTLSKPDLGDPAEEMITMKDHHEHHHNATDKLAYNTLKYLVDL
ncbi:MAG TPA: hypothetical protein VH396_09105 [Chitinophagaceae bacterium]